MLSYALKRCCYSILIILGVLLLTFVLFRIAAGDPAATVLGKNPTPEELESMRLKLGSGKPLICGTKLRTELFSSAELTSSRTVRTGTLVSGDHQLRAEGMFLRENASILWKRNFDLPPGTPVFCRVLASSDFLLNGKQYSPAEGKETIRFFPVPEKLILAPEPGRTLTVKEVSFFRPTEHFFDSQLADSFREIVAFRKTFPYMSFFNFGETLLTHEPIREVLQRGMWASLLLMLPIFFGEILTGIVLAMLSAVFRGKWPDHVIMFLSVAGMSISYLALIIFGQWFFGYYLNLFPVWGWDGPRYLLLPVIIGIVSGTGSGVRFYRTVFLNEMNREYLRTAVAKGCSPFRVYFNHLLKNAMIPILTRASTVLPFLFTGSLLLESFFGIPGLGYKGVDALNSSDLQTLKALVLLGSFLFIFINLVTDLLYAWADPRIRLK